MYGNLEHVTASSSDLARLLNLSTRRVQQLVKAGLLPTPGPSGPSDRGSRSGVSARLAATDPHREFIRGATEIDRSANADSPGRARGKTRALVSRSAVEGEFFTLARTIRDNFKNFPARCSGLVASEGDQEGCHAILAGEVRQVLEGFAQRSGNGNGQDTRPAAAPRQKDPPPPQ